MKILSIDNLNRFFNYLVSIFASKTELETKVDKEAGKGLSTNDFTDVYRNNIGYVKPVPEEDMMALLLKGPDDRIYRLKLDENLRLGLEGFISPEKVNYLVSGDQYYYISENEDGTVYLTLETEELPEGATTGKVRVVDNDTNTKYEINVEDGAITFVEVIRPSTEGEAGYLIDRNDSSKSYFFKIYKGDVYVECLTVVSKVLSVSKPK